LAEYTSKGVPNIWVIDPRLRDISVYNDGALVKVKAERVVAMSGETEVELTRDEIFAD
jgi:Uma2 family endonuclease